ncbi:FBP domain-containing protein [Secundilactobacillus odoratitofui]|uniref:FBP domain-containing protein n=1 Tax=Secundilactobacillus odoratitofui TaxID=480930 RepID=UPI002092C6AB|nr:FBP domain-containing protein [Secundilactobacillus odoratitofui]
MWCRLRYQPANKLKRSFVKLKKLKQPNFNALELSEQTFIGWNDIATQRKYMLYYDDNKLAGVYGDLSVSVIKGFCTICHQESNVSLFTAISKKGSEGRYTKKR